MPPIGKKRRYEELNEKSFEKHHYSLVGKVSGRSIGFKLWAFIVGRNNNTSSLNYDFDSNIVIRPCYNTHLTITIFVIEEDIAKP